MKTPVAILVRVSTDRQEFARQVHELTAVALANGWEVVETIAETISGTAGADDRRGLQKVEEAVAAGRVRKVLVHEVSRLARRPAVLHAFVERLEEAGVSLYWHSQRIETLLPGGKRNPAAGIMLALLAEMARHEVETLRERIKSGLDAARRRGRRLGRPMGSGMSADVLLRKHGDVARLLRAGHSVRHAAKISGKGESTVQRVRKHLFGSSAQDA